MAKEQQRFIDLLPKAEYLEHHLNGLGWHKVTYCKDCKYLTAGICWIDKVNYKRVEYDDYCSRAEREEHETD